MTRSEYRLQCLARSSPFIDSVLRFHRKYPPVFVSSGQALAGDRLKSSLPVIPRGDALIGTPETFEQLELLSGFAAEAVLVPMGFRRVLPEDGASYFDALGRGSPEEWSKEFQALKGKWPDIEPSALRWPATAPFVPRPRAVGAGIELPAGVRMVIPIYKDTTEAEKDTVWRDAMRLKRLVYGRTKKRVRATLFEERLRVWDAYQRLKNYSWVAKELGLSVSRVKRRRAEAFLDIEGRPPLGSIKQRRAAGMSREQLSAAWTSCQRCSRADRMQDLCPKHRAALGAYVDQDAKSMRERLGGTGDEILPPGRKKKRMESKSRAST